MQQYLGKTTITCLIILLSTSINAQYKKKHQFLEGFKVQPKVGFNMFYGDLVSTERTRYIFGVNAEKELNEYLNARFDLSMGSMKGSQQMSSGDVYAYFVNEFAQYNFGATFRPLDLAYGLFKQRRFNPYIIGQIGVIQWKAREFFGNAAHSNDYLAWRGIGYDPIDTNGDGYDDNFERNGTWGFAPTITGGFGCAVFVNSRISINAEWNGTYAFTDELDAHAEWTDNEGNVHQTAGNDFFYLGTIGVTYLFDDSQWRNSPKYNRKAYLRTKSLYKPSSKKHRRPSKRKSKRYKR